MRCSIAGRRARASRRPTANRSVCRARWATSPTSSTAKTSPQLTGPMAIGHVRYSTAGESRVANAQPFLIDCAHGQIAICHNGNLVNASELKDDAGAAGLDLPVEHRHRSRAAPVRAVEESRRSKTRWSTRSRRCRARFRSCMMTHDRLIAVRDPHGFRPLALGRLDDAYVVCSETCAMDLIGATYVRDVEPGEILVISADGLQSLQPFPPAPSRAVRVRARVLLPARQLRVRQERQRSPHQPRPHSRARAARGRRRHRARSRLRRLRGDGIRRRVEDPAAHGPDPQSLRRPHVHPAAVSRSATSA